MPPARPLGEADLDRENDRRRKAWDEQASGYDRRIGFFERHLFGSHHRSLVCSQAEGEVLEVAVGTGLNLPLYPEGVTLTAIDLSPEMLAIARTRAAEQDRDVVLREGDAHNLPFADGSFDSVVCTYSLCNIPDEARAIAEMKRVLRPGGKLLLLDHIRSSVAPVYWVQRAIELLSLRIDGDHMTRRPLEHVRAHGFEIVSRDRSRWGVVERVVAIRP